MKPTIRTILAAATALVLAVSAGCAAEDLESEPLGNIEKSSYIASTQAWPLSGAVPNLIANIPVCWETSGFATEKGWVQSVVESRYENQPFFHLNFTGWGSCVAGSPGIHINILDETLHPHTALLGKSLNGLASGIVFNFTFVNWGADPKTGFNYCHSTEAARKDCIERIGVHEFGHGLGLAHEQNRPDKPASCDDAPQAASGDMLVGNFDYNSLMSYCPDDLPHWNNGGLLTQTDVAGLSRLYGGGGDVYVGVSTSTLSTSTFNSGFARLDNNCRMGSAGETCMTGDVNNDRRADLVILDRATGNVNVRLASITGDFAAPTLWRSSYYHWGPDYVVIGDVNNDGRADLINLTQANGDVYVALSQTNSTFATPVKWHDTFASVVAAMYIYDYNNDGRADLMGLAVDGTNTVRVALSTGTSFGAIRVWHSGYCLNGRVGTGDVNNDKRADLVCFDSATGDVRVNLSSGTSFAAGAGTLWRSAFSPFGEGTSVADINGDGYADIVKTMQNGGWVYTATSNGSQFVNYAWSANGQCLSGDSMCWFADITGDLKADFISFKPNP